MTLYAVTQFLKPWLSPPGLNLLPILLGLLLYVRLRKLGMFFIILGFLSFWFLSAPVVVYSMLNVLQDQYPILQPLDLAHPKKNYAIVILGGGDTVRAEYGYKHTVSDATRNRVNYAAYLQQKMHLPILVSGGKNKGAAISEAELMMNHLQESFQIKADYVENESVTTADESKYVSTILKQNHLEGVYLVTHAWHMPRSVYIFKCAGINVIPAPMGHYVYGPGYALISYLPNMEAFYASAVAMHEWIGLLWYHLYYGNQCKK